MRSGRLARGATSKPRANIDKRVFVFGKAEVTRTMRTVFFLWLVISIALILMAFSQRRAIIDLLRTASSASTPATVTLAAPPWNPWTYGAHILARDLPFLAARRKTAC